VHIPDGYLNPATAAGTYLVSGATAYYAVKKLKEKVEEERIPIYGVTAALIFAAQMVNFPVLYGTSGHLIGGLLAALIAGPFGGFLIMTTVLVIQALLFADGGITALGANILNMAFVGSLGAYYVYFLLTNTFKNEKFAIPLAAWISVVAAALTCSLELWLSGKADLKLVLPAMLGIHALIGIGEAIITLGLVEAIKGIRPDIAAFRVGAVKSND
jgi:cobalt/nickel transport system permease protein